MVWESGRKGDRGFIIWEHIAVPRDSACERRDSRTTESFEDFAAWYRMVQDSRASVSGRDEARGLTVGSDRVSCRALLRAASTAEESDEGLIGRLSRKDVWMTPPLHRSHPWSMILAGGGGDVLAGSVTLPRWVSRRLSEKKIVIATEARRFLNRESTVVSKSQDAH